MDNSVVKNVYDYSNVLPTIEMISYLVKYCDNMYKQLQKLVEEDEEKNKKLKTEFKNNMFKHSYKMGFEVTIKDYNHVNIVCKDYEQFLSAAQGGKISNINSFKINLDMSFYRGKGDNTQLYDNSFVISFEPFNVTFIRNSNNNDQSMNQIEDGINSIMKKFPIIDCIFTKKSS